MHRMKSQNKESKLSLYVFGWCGPARSFGFGLVLHNSGALEKRETTEKQCSVRIYINIFHSNCCIHYIYYYIYSWIHSEASETFQAAVPDIKIQSRFEFSAFLHPLTLTSSVRAPNSGQCQKCIFKGQYIMIDWIFANIIDTKMIISSRSAAI